MKFCFCLLLQIFISYFTGQPLRTMDRRTHRNMEILTKEVFETERELLEQLLNEVKELKASQNEMKIAQYDISERLDAINMKCDITRKKVDDLALDMKLMERGIRTDIRKLQDTTETIVVVLQGQGLLPKAL